MSTALEEATFGHAANLVIDVYGEATHWMEDELRREAAECDRSVARIRARAERDVQETLRHYDLSMQDTRVRGQRYQAMLRDINQRFAEARQREGTRPPRE